MESSAVASSSRPLQIYFLPQLAPGHMIPLLEMSRLFAARGERVTILTTTSNAILLQKAVDRDTAAGHHIVLQLFPFPSKEVGLPEGVENIVMAKDYDTAAKIHVGTTLLKDRIEDFMVAHPPDCIVSDMFHPWTADTALRLRIPRIVFHATCIFSMSLKNAVRGPDSPHLRVESDDEPFVITTVPDKITMTRSMLPDYVRKPYGYTQLMEQFREAELKSYGVLVNNFAELETEYIEHYQKLMDHKVYHIGPVSLIHRSGSEKTDRGHEAVVGEIECLNFLDSKKPSSVLYVCFGSTVVFPDEQLKELAFGLESSGHNFIWVVFGKDNDGEEEERKWLPEGFRTRTEQRGMIIKGWAPQILIVDHPSVGGFMTHCGWNSVLECVSSGIPMVTWPLYAEHFYNEKLVTQVLGIGVEVGKKDWNLWIDAGKNVVGKEKVEAAVKKLMDGSDPVAVEMRERARALGETAKKAVEKGGSSYKNITVLIEELKQLRDETNKGLMTEC